MHSILVTGGTGYFGQHFVRHLLKHSVCERIVVYSRSEHIQAQMRLELKLFDRRIRYFVGDVRDRDRLTRALHDVDTVVHAAALKRIETAYYNPLEVVKTNVGGAENLIESAIDSGVNKVVFLSTDKAYQPISLYGLTKATAECLLLNANNMRGWTGPIFSVVRYGNVWNSTGSVVPTWKSILAGGTKRVPVSDPECTRFFMTIEQAVRLVTSTIVTMKGGEIEIPDLPAYRLGDLAEAMGAEMDVRGLDTKIEKLHESMCEGKCSEDAPRMSVADLQGALEDVA